MTDCDRHPEGEVKTTPTDKGSEPETECQKPNSSVNYVGFAPWKKSQLGSALAKDPVICDNDTPGLFRDGSLKAYFALPAG